MQPRITDYKSELLTREQIISRPDPPAKWVGESERTPVNIVNKGSFRYTGFQYTSLLPTDRLTRLDSERQKLDLLS